MTAFLVKVNGQSVCTVGEINCIGLSAELVSAKLGPMGLKIVSLSESGESEERVITWYEYQMKIGDTISLTLVPDNCIGQIVPRKYVPQLGEQTNSSILWTIDINKGSPIKADFGSLDQIQAKLLWPRGKYCSIDIASVSWNDEQVVVWLKDKLTLGDEITFLVTEN